MSLLNKPNDNLNDNQKQVIEAYVWIRKHNQSIPDHILNTMKLAALESFKTKPKESPMLNTERIHESILDEIRENLGVNPGDTSMDEKINCMTRDGLFDRWCTWNGLINWGGKIRGAIREIYGVEFQQ